ncbi:MAG: biopolymer transporter ExbD [Muribaculaceae bacterium]|nr:biopolymer transporter ExbD [Muribaculaceae bacterium]
MALKRQNEISATFSMASMTDVIFLLLVFFMVTSTFVFPTALEVNLPQSSEQTAIKPGTRVYLDREMQIFVSYDKEEPQPIHIDYLVSYLVTLQVQAPESYIALYADEEVPYGKVIEVLNLAAQNNLKMVLATKPAPTSAQPKAPSL